MTDLDGPHQLLVRALGGPTPLHTTGESGRVDLGAFTRALLLADPSLDLDDGLAGRLEAWAQARPTAGTARSELLRHAGEGLSLAQSLAARLGPRWVVRYWDGAYDTVKFVCWGCRRLHWSLDEHGTPSFPVRVTVEAEYKWYPLRADGFGDFAPDDSTAVMHLSEGLVADLYQWAKDFDTGMERYLRDRDDAADDVRRGELDLRGQELAERIARELGPARQVTYGGIA